MVESEVIVLRKQPYREESILLSTLSPDYGRIDLVARAAAKSGGKNYPAIDLFRHLEVAINAEEPAELNTIYRADLLGSFDGIADDHEKFDFAVKAGAFLLRNTQSNLPSPMVFDAWKRVLAELNKRDGWSVQLASTVIKLTFLSENGLLPEITMPGQEEKAELMQAFIDQVIEASISDGELPEGSSELWRQLGNYVNNLIREHKLPWS